MPIVNGLKVPLGESSTIKDIIEKFFDIRCEFLVNRNSKSISANKYHTCKIKENDILQIVAYSKYCYKLRGHSIFKPDD